MIRKKYKMQRTIECTSAVEFDEKVNAIVQEHSTENVEVIRRMDVKGHCAYVTWEEESLKPETAKDRLSLKGIDIRCGDCPFFELPDDKRIKFIRCDKDNRLKRCSYDSYACEWMCEQIEKGEVEI